MMEEAKGNLNETYLHKQGQTEVEEKSRKRAKGFEAALNYFKSQLWKASGRHALNYLIIKREYTKEEIEAMELGFFPFKIRVKKQLKDLFNSLGLNAKGFGGSHKIVIPYRDPEGRLKGFIVRRLDNKRPKYIYSEGIELDTLFNLNETRGQEHIILVEGYFDALIATQRGIKGVVAIGGAKLTEEMLEDIIRYGAKSITLIPDNDENSFKGIERSLALIKGKDLSAFVIELPEEFEDLDQFIRKKGIVEFEKLRNQAKSGDKWEAKESLGKRGKIKVQIRNDNTRTTHIYYIKKGKETRQKENNS
jgi:DNA primase catalytic core